MAVRIGVGWSAANTAICSFVYVFLSLPRQVMEGNRERSSNIIHVYDGLFWTQAVVRSWSLVG